MCNIRSATGAKSLFLNRTFRHLSHGNEDYENCITVNLKQQSMKGCQIIYLD